MSSLSMKQNLLIFLSHECLPHLTYKPLSLAHLTYYPRILLIMFPKKWHITICVVRNCTMIYIIASYTTHPSTMLASSLLFCLTNLLKVFMKFPRKNIQWPCPIMATLLTMCTSKCTWIVIMLQRKCFSSKHIASMEPTLAFLMLDIKISLEEV